LGKRLVEDFSVQKLEEIFVIGQEQLDGPVFHSILVDKLDHLNGYFGVFAKFLQKIFDLLGRHLQHHGRIQTVLRDLELMDEGRPTHRLRNLDEKVIG
jgi:hypothetical protein